MGEGSENTDKLAVIWSSSDKGVAMNMVFMYTRNSKLRKWWNDVRLIVWGPSTKLLTEDSELQDQLYDTQKAGVELLACKACCENYGVTKNLEDLGVKVIYMGEPLTEMLKTGWKVITF